jgi:hypothetical protein
MAVVLLPGGSRRFWKVLPRKGMGILEGDLAGEVGSGMHFHLREAGFIWVWWTQGAISATSTVVGKTK